MGWSSALGVAAGLMCAVGPMVARAQGTGGPGDTTQSWAVYGQSTVTDQYHPAFRSAFRGSNSLDPGSRGDETVDATVYAGVRPWAGAEVWINPEVDQGFGLSDTLGVAAFPSAEAYKVGASVPYVRLQRVFLRQTIDLGGAEAAVDPALNVLGGRQAADRLVLWAGKLSVGDVFDTNAYANDSRNQFLNWALVNTASFDYAADAWGYSYGTAVEWYQGRWTVRGGAFALSRVPNSAALDTSGGQVQFLAEVEERHTLWGQAGTVKLTGFLTRGRMGDYDAATAAAVASGAPADIAATRRYRSRTGISANLQQAVTAELGVFARAGVSEGGREAYEFTDVDKAVSMGAALMGKAWGRPDDTVGVGLVGDDISRRAKNFLNAGGLGILIGDGGLPRSGPEDVMETYYRYAFDAHAQLTADYQFIDNPGYNRLRGPVSVLGVRLHLQY